MDELIRPDQVPLWIPGQLTLDSVAQGWDGLMLRGYRYVEQDVQIPAMRDYMIVRYKGVGAEAARMSRCSGGRWESSPIKPGMVSILTRAERSQWKWDRPIDVSHVYLSQDAIAAVAAELYERDIADVGMEDHVGGHDQAIPALMDGIERELVAGAFGGSLYVDTLKTQLCIHLLRRYARVEFREHGTLGRLSLVQRRQIVDYIEAHLDKNILLQDLARLSGFSVSHFIRKFRAAFDCAPHAYLLRRRVARAQHLLRGFPEMPLKGVAAQCGFADQSHMTRAFTRHLGQTPLSWRQHRGYPEMPAHG